MPKLRLKQLAQDGAADGDVMTWVDSQGEWEPAAPIFGADYQYASAPSETTTSSTSPITKLSMTTPTLTGTYRVAFGLALKHESSNSHSLGSFTLDPGAISFQIEPKDADNTYSYQSARDIVFSAESRTFEITHSTSNGSHLSTALDAYIEFFRVA